MLTCSSSTSPPCGSIFGATDQPNLRPEKTDQHAHNAAEEHFGNPVQPAFESNLGGGTGETGGNDDRRGDRGLPPHRLNAYQIGGDQDRDGKCNRDHPGLAAAEQEENETNDTADHHVDNAAAKQLARLLRLRVGGGNQRGNRPYRTAVVEGTKSEPDNAAGDENVYGKPNSEEAVVRKAEAYSKYFGRS